MSRTLWYLLFLCQKGGIGLAENKKQPEPATPVKGFNTRVKECKEGIAKVVNDAKLPPAMLEAILGEFYRQIQAQTLQAIETERKSIEEGDKDGEEIHKD